MLANDEWKYDTIPEIMDGKNIADFVDVDIEARLQELEREEEELQRQAELLHPVDDEESDLEEEEKELVGRIKTKQKLMLHQKYFSNTVNKPILPRKFRVRKLEQAVTNLTEMGLDTSKFHRSRSRPSRGIKRTREERDVKMSPAPSAPSSRSTSPSGAAGAAGAAGVADVAGVAGAAGAIGAGEGVTNRRGRSRTRRSKTSSSNAVDQTQTDQELPVTSLRTRSVSIPRSASAGRVQHILAAAERKDVMIESRARSRSASASRMTRAESRSASRGVDRARSKTPQPGEGFRNVRQKREAEKQERFALRPTLRHGRLGEADRRHYDMKPKHLFSGKIPRRTRDRR